MVDNVDWEKVKMDYLTGDFTHKKLCKKYAINLAQLRYRINRYGWNDLKQKPSALKGKSKNHATKSMVDYNNEHLKMYEDCAKIIRVLTRLYLKNNLEPDAGVLQKIVAAVEKIQKGQRVSLGMDKETGEVELPVINFVENLNKDKL